MHTKSKIGLILLWAGLLALMIIIVHGNHLFQYFWILIMYLYLNSVIGMHEFFKYVSYWTIVTL